MHSQVMNYLEDHNIVFEQQDGFRRSYSCGTQVAGLVQDLPSSVDAGTQVDTMLLDSSNAFHRVPHQRLLLRLSQPNIPPHVLA